MKFKYKSFTLVFMISSSLFSPLSILTPPPAKSENISNKLNKITIDYLNQLPQNDYIIGPGDRLVINVGINAPGDLNLFSTSTLVDGEGTINIPRLKRIFVNGLTINELTKLLNDAYLKFVKYPDVKIDISNYRPITVLVDGEVVSPGLARLAGSYSLSKADNDNKKPFPNQFVKDGQDNLDQNYFFPTVFDAIRSSGGITRFSDLSNIQVIRKNNISNGSGEITTTLNLNNLLINGDSSQNIRIYNSDIIRVGKLDNPDQSILSRAILSDLNPKFINVSVIGKVNSPGNIKVSRASVLNDAILLAGGLKVLKGPIKFIRFNIDGTIDKRQFKYKKNAKRGTYKNPSLLEGDMIFIGNSLLSATNEVITEISSPFVGIFSTYGIIKALSD